MRRVKGETEPHLRKLDFALWLRLGLFADRLGRKRTAGASDDRRFPGDGEPGHVRQPSSGVY